MTLKAKLKFCVLKLLQPYYFKKNADLIFTETDDVNLRVTKLLNFEKEQVYTVSNTLNGLLKIQTVMITAFWIDYLRKNQMIFGW